MFVGYFIKPNLVDAVSVIILFINAYRATKRNGSDTLSNKLK